MCGKLKCIEGKFTILKPVDEDDFEYIIKWRNDPKLNKYLNQPFELNMDIQKKWYQEKYLPSDDILYVMIEKSTGSKFGTIGINDRDDKKSTAISGRLIIGEYKYRGSKEFLEALLLMFDFIFFELKIKKIYSHAVKQNTNALLINSKLGFTPTEKKVYPQYCNLNGKEHIELYNTEKKYLEKRNDLEKIVDFYAKKKLQK